jgi:hypothetical protein
MFHQIKERLLYVGGVTGAVYEQAEEAGESQRSGESMHKRSEITKVIIFIMTFVI